MDVHRKLDELVGLVEGARAMPMSASCVVNRAEVLALLDDLRKHLPPQLAEARHLVAERDAVIENARREAQGLIEEARAERSRMLAATPDAREAVAEADRLRTRSLDEIEAMRAEVDEYIDSKLANFEVVLTRTMSAVQRGRDRLRGGHHADALRSSVGTGEHESAADVEATSFPEPAGEASGGFDDQPQQVAEQPGYGSESQPEGVGSYAGTGFVTGEYPSVDAPSGEYVRADYPSGEYVRTDYPSGEYASPAYPPAEYVRGDLASGEYASPGAVGSGEYVAAGYPRAADYPSSVDYPQPADYSLSGYPDVSDGAGADVANPADFGSAEDRTAHPAYPHYSTYQGYGDR